MEPEQLSSRGICFHAVPVNNKTPSPQTRRDQAGFYVNQRFASDNQTPSRALGRLLSAAGTRLGAVSRLFSAAQAAPQRILVVGDGLDNPLAH